MSLPIKNKLSISDSQYNEIIKRRRIDEGDSFHQMKPSNVNFKIDFFQPSHIDRSLNEKTERRPQLAFSASIQCRESIKNRVNYQSFLNPHEIQMESNSNPFQRSFPLEIGSPSHLPYTLKQNNAVKNALIWHNSLPLPKDEITPEFIKLLKLQFGNALGNEIPKFLGRGSYFKVYKIILNNNPYVIKIFRNRVFIEEKMTDHVAQEIKYYFRIFKSDIPTVRYKEWDHLINASEEEIVNFVNSEFPGFYLAPYVTQFNNNDVYENFLELGLSYDELEEEHPYCQIKEMLLKFYNEDIIPDATGSNMGIQKDGKVVLLDLFNEKLEQENPSYTYDSPKMTRLDDAASDIVPDYEEDPQSTDLYRFLMPAPLRDCP